VAAVNGPASVVLAGDRQELARVVAAAEAEGARVRWLPVSYASHGPDVDQVARGLARDLAGIVPAAGRIPLWSAVTGQVADGSGLDREYWVANLREQVRFEDVIRGLAGAGHGVFVEVSPHPVLVTAVEATLADAGHRDAVVAGTLRRGEGGPGRLLASAAEVFVRGVAVDWAEVFAGSGARRVELPTYAFQRRRYWPDVRAQAVALPVAGGDGMEAGFWAAVDRQDVAGLAGQVGVAGDEPLSVVPSAAAAVAGGLVAVPGVVGAGDRAGGRRSGAGALAAGGAGRAGRGWAGGGVLAGAGSWRRGCRDGHSRRDTTGPGGAGGDAGRGGRRRDRRGDVAAGAG
jgi:acyl transferase domain-containing protein